MAKKEDPYLLENLRFLPPQKRVFIDAFFKKLDDNCREFAIKRYVEGKTINQVADEMGYAERSVYAYRDRIINLWQLYSDNDRVEYHKHRILRILQKHGSIKHTKLYDNLNLNKTGLSKSEFAEILNCLVFTGVINVYSINIGSKGRPGRKYVLNKPVINL